MAKIKQGTAVDLTWQKKKKFLPGHFYWVLRLVDIAHSLFL